jgi:hypothetical protein
VQCYHYHYFDAVRKVRVTRMLAMLVVAAGYVTNTAAWAGRDCDMNFVHFRMGLASFIRGAASGAQKTLVT